MTLIPRATRQCQAITTRLAIERMALGLTQREVADQIGGRQDLISQVESGNRSPYLDTIIAIAGAYGLTVALVAKHQQPWLALSAAELDTIRAAASAQAETPGSSALLRSALAKLAEPAEEADRD